MRAKGTWTGKSVTQSLNSVGQRMLSASPCLFFTTTPYLSCFYNPSVNTCAIPYPFRWNLLPISIFLIFQSLPLSSDDVDISEDAVSSGNFAVKSRAALSSLSSPPDRVSYSYSIAKSFFSRTWKRVQYLSLPLQLFCTVLIVVVGLRTTVDINFLIFAQRYTLINVQTQKCTHYDTMIF